jgi:redox-sensitive bicupin YhaK (pirin superfamily)
MYLKKTKMDRKIIHRADTRGYANHGWLESYHTFSFANYYNPERIHFGVLRVLNDDRIDAGIGFGTHPHENMEIISIPLEGDLQHKDSMGNTAIIRQGDIQVMSAGTGIQHSEFNPNNDQLTRFLQIWILPNKKNVTPRYDQLTLDPNKSKNQLQQILSPNSDDEGVWIHQNAWFHLGNFDKQVTTDYQLNNPANGVYAFVLEGSFELNGEILQRRDGMGLSGPELISIKSLVDKSSLLLMEVSMAVN